MAQRGWFTLMDNELGDLKAESEQLSARFWQRVWVFAVLEVVGALLMGLAPPIGLIAIGCFMAVTGVVGFFVLVAIYHTQECLYRAIVEMRKLSGTTADR